MPEFNSRIEAQRTILDAVNGHNWSEELYGYHVGRSKDGLPPTVYARTRASLD
jgi:hypothetical protein